VDKPSEPSSSVVSGNEPQGRDRRINARLLSHWEEIKGNLPFPEESKINPEALHDIWESCFLIDARHYEEGNGFRYAYLGQSLIEAYGEDYSGGLISGELVHPESGLLLAKFREVITRKEPVIYESEFVNRKQLLIKYRACMLPLGREGKYVDYIIGSMKWKIC
jgi:hypothetical protein